MVRLSPEMDWQRMIPGFHQRRSADCVASGGVAYSDVDGVWMLVSLTFAAVMLAVVVVVGVYGRSDRSHPTSLR